MSEKLPDLNALRGQSIKDKEQGILPKVDDGGPKRISTRLEFEALPKEAQEDYAREAGYLDVDDMPDVESYKNKHYSGLDIDKLRKDLEGKF